MMPILFKRSYTYIFSGTLIAASIIALSLWGLRLGIDFTGGTLMEVRFGDTPPSEQILNDVVTRGGGRSIVVQPSENNAVILRYVPMVDEDNEKIFTLLKELDENVQQLRVDFIGATISEQITSNALVAIALSVIGIALYIAWAFRKVSYPIPSWQYGLCAIIALAHDIIITVGAFAVLGKFFGIEIGVPFIAALITILGYSVNDTIVVYDRIRENILRARSVANFEEIVNISINETLARSINTSLTVIIVLIILSLFGGPGLFYFSVALLIGITFGTYSSIFIASAFLVTSHKLSHRR